MLTVNKISVKGFKSIGDAEVELRPVNVLIGANGSGKSNLIEVFSLLRAVCAGRLQDYVARAGGAGRILHYGAGVTEALRIDVQLGKDGYRYGIVLKPTGDDGLYVADEYGAAGERIDADGKDPFQHWRVYHFHDTGANSPFKKTGDLRDNRYLRADGANLAAFLYFLREKHSFEYGFIRNTIESAAPFFDDFRLEPLTQNPDKIRMEWRHKGMDDYFDASVFSGGTLRYIALATLFLQPQHLRPPVILLDEPELGLNPYCLVMLEAMVNRASKLGSQVIMAAQSPNLLDLFNPDDVLVANRVKGGTTAFTRLDPDQLDVWLEKYSMGELWEKNHFGGRPAGSYRERGADG